MCRAEDYKISVIVPVYKVEKYLNQCVESLLSQSYHNLEILLIDDGSPDTCPKICEYYRKKDKRVHVIHKKNGGLASSRNCGLDIASGDLISFVDSDDWIDEHMYCEMIKMKKETGADIVCCDGIRTNGKSNLGRCFDCKTTGTVLSGTMIAKEILLDKVGSQVVKGLYDKKCWEDIRFPQGMLYEDIPVAYRAFEKAKTVAYVDEAYYKYRVNEQGISNSPNPIKSYHIFLGFKDHYEYAKNFYPDIEKECCTKAAQFAISTFFHFCSDGKEELKPYILEIEEFLKKNKQYINYQCLPISRKIALKIFYFSKKIFKLLCLFFLKSGLQKKLDYEIK